jgi:hypothetical protein
MKRELEPAIVSGERTASELWRIIIESVDLRDDVILPVVIVNIEGNQVLGKFHVSYVIDGQKRYLQLENFDAPEHAEAFLKYCGDNIWKTCIGGIYRLEL